MNIIKDLDWKIKCFNLLFALWMELLYGAFRISISFSLKYAYKILQMFLLWMKWMQKQMQFHWTQNDLFKYAALCYLCWLIFGRMFLMYLHICISIIVHVWRVKKTHAAAKTFVKCAALNPLSVSRQNNLYCHAHYHAKCLEIKYSASSDGYSKFQCNCRF